MNFYEDLRPYQIVGVDRIAATPRFLLFDKPGLGKGPQFIRGCDKAGAKRLLIFCKGIARRHWESEIKRWGLIPRGVQVIEGLRQRLSSDASIVINYDVASAYAHQLAEHKFDAAGVDEGQDLKNPFAARTAAVYGQGGALSGITARRTLITGSPVLNHYGELWSHFMAFFTERQLRAAGIPTSYATFLDTFTVMEDRGFGPEPVRSKNPEPLARFLAAHSLRREEVGNLPPLRFEPLRLPGGAAFTELLAHERGMDLGALRAQLAAADPDKADLLVLDALKKGLDNARFRHLSGLAKVDPTCQIVEDELDSGLDKIIIFAYHRDVLAAFHQRLLPYGALLVWGGMDQNNQQRVLDEFRYTPEARVLVAQINIVSTSITLISACEGLNVEPDWVPDNNMQAAKRMHRIGQERPVRMRFPSLAGSIDEALTRTLLRKTREIAPLWSPR